MALKSSYEFIRSVKEQPSHEQDHNYEIEIEDIRATVINLYGQEISELISIGGKGQELKEYVKTVVAEEFPKYNSASQIERIYSDIFMFSFINKYLDDPNFEEMNGNAWNDIEVITTKGNFKIEDKFNSPIHAMNIIKKMMAVGGAILNDADPSLDSFIGTGLRLTASIPPVVDEDAGVTFSLRKLSGRMLSKKQLVEEYDSYSYEELDFLDMCLRYKISVLFGGATSSGKSSDLQTVLYDIFADGKLRGYCIEENTRELDFVVKRNNKTISRVIHTKTREGKNNRVLKVDSDLLVKTALRYHPDIIVPAEMRGKEAMSAVEAALTGHTVASSAHVQSVTKAYERILILCNKADGTMNEEMLMSTIVEAFPIVVFKQQLEDKSRRCMRVFEATGYNKREKIIEGRILFRFVKDENLTDEGRVLGEHKVISKPSLRLCQKLFESGCPIERIRNFRNDFALREDVDYIEHYIDTSQEEI